MSPMRKSARLSIHSGGARPRDLAISLQLRRHGYSGHVPGILRTASRKSADYGGLPLSVCLSFGATSSLLCARRITLAYKSPPCKALFKGHATPLCVFDSKPLWTQHVLWPRRQPSVSSGTTKVALYLSTLVSHLQSLSGLRHSPASLISVFVLSILLYVYFTMITLATTHCNPS